MRTRSVRAEPRLVGADDGRAVYEVVGERAARKLSERHAGPGQSWIWSSEASKLGEMAFYFFERFGDDDRQAVYRVVLKAWPDPREMEGD